MPFMQAFTSLIVLYISSNQKQFSSAYKDESNDNSTRQTPTMALPQLFEESTLATTPPPPPSTTLATTTPPLSTTVPTTTTTTTTITTPNWATVPTTTTTPPPTTTSSSTTTTSTTTTTTSSSSTTTTSSSTTTTTELYIMLVCPESKYYHEDSEKNLTFPETPIKVRTTSKEICTCKNIPILRTCSETGTWDAPVGSCCDSNITEITTNLNDLYLNMANENWSTTIEAVNSITENSRTELASLDVHLIAQILNKAQLIEDISNNSNNFFGIINNIMDANDNILLQSQLQLNSTDTILYNLDRMLVSANTSNVIYKNIFASLASSDKLLVLKSNKTNECNSYSTEFLNSGDHESILDEMDFEIAISVPADITESGYFFTLFCKEVLFNQYDKVAFGGRVISLLLRGETSHAQNSKIKVYFKELNKASNQICSHWKYGLENSLPITGNWSSNGDAVKYKKGTYLCEFNHTTHFTILVSGSAVDSFVLDLITIFGSVLSVIGIAVLFVSAILFKRWRREVKNKIFLNVASCLLLLIVVFIVSDRIEQGPGCIAVGILLHYVVIAHFCWTLVISHCNYNRIIKVYLTKPTHILAKYCTFAWATPVIVVAVVTAIDFNTYDKNVDVKTSQICYPKGIYNTLGVLLPVSVVLAINLGLFVFLIKRLLVKNYKVERHKVKRTFEVEKFLILAFSMMGLTWIFGILASVTRVLVFDYLFCTTATCQGFVFFLFYILDSDDLKQEWVKLTQRVTGSKTKLKEQSSNQTTESNG